MKKSILCGIALVAGLWSCTEDYTNWGSPQSNTANDAEPKLEMAVQPTVSSIDFANYQEETIQLFTTNLTKEEANEYAVAISGEDINHTPIVINANSEGRVITKEFTQVIEKLYGRAPVERSLIIEVATIATKETADGDVNVRRVANPFKMKATLDAPYIASAYYLIGGEKDWNEVEALTQPFTHSGKDVYEDPVFSFVITGGAERWFSFGDASQIAATTAGDWKQLYGYVGEQTEKGTFARRCDIEGAPDNTFHVDGSAKFYRFTVNMLTMEYEITPINFSNYIYEAGCNNSWGEYQQPLYCPDGNGTYTGYFFAKDDSWTDGKGAFKFRGDANGWDNGNYGTGTFDEAALTGTLIDDGGSGNIMPAPGFYRADVNLADMTFKLTAINSVYVVGSAVNNDWDTGVAMTFNHDKHCWECDATFTEAGVIKFKGNGTWDSQDGNWGGTMDNIINGSNDNIPVTLSGDVHIEFYPLCDTKSYCTITAR